MHFADDFWLRATATQRTWSHMVSYGAAFYGTAAFQAWKLGIDAPAAFWNAISRASDRAPAAKVEVPAPGPVAAVTPDPAPEPTPEPEPERIAELSEPKDTEVPNPVLLDAPRAGAADDLTTLSGVGAKLAAALNEFGIYHFDQIASLTDDGIDWLNAQQPGFKALVSRFDLVTQAKAVAG